MVYFDFDSGIWFSKGKKFSTMDEASDYETRQKSGRRFYNEVDDTYYRSRWEIVTANAFHESGIVFQYEPKRFMYHKHKESYLPDFYLPDFNVWVEVKGFMDKRSKKRIVLFGREYPEEQLVLVMADEIERLKANPRSIVWVLYEQGVDIDAVF